MFVQKKKEAFDTVRENPQLHKRIHLHHFAQGILKHKTKEQAAPLRPREDVRAGLERLRDAPFKLNAPLMFEIPQTTHNIFLGKSKCVVHAHTTGRRTALERLGQVKHQRDRSLVFFARAALKSFHCEPSSPHLVLCPSIAPNSRNPTQCHSRHLNTSSARTPTTESK